MAVNIPNDIKYANTFNSKILQNLPKFVISGLKNIPSGNPVRIANNYCISAMAVGDAEVHIKNQATKQAHKSLLLRG
jgi:hypothetical protein